MELRQAIVGRRSTAPIIDEAPTDEQLRGYLRLAAHAPDHAALRPWRLVTVRGSQRDRLGAALSAGFGDVAGSSAEQRTRAKTLRAPLLIGIIAAPAPHPKVPEWEQLAAAAAVVTTLQLVMFAEDWVTFWRSGPATELAEVRAVMGAADHERLLGWLYTGRSAADQTAPAQTEPDQPAPDQQPAGSVDVGAKLTSLDETS